MGEVEKALELAARLDGMADTDIVQWTTPEGNFPHPRYAPVEREWVAFVRSFGAATPPMPSYDEILQGLLPTPTIANIAIADLDYLKGAATWVIRGERFSDGHTASAQKNGLLSAVLRRYAELAALKDS